MRGNAINKVYGRGIYIAGNDIDTDRIIPARFLKCVTFDELGPSLFYDERFDQNGNTKGHVLDSAAYQGAEILISDANFGCGSSREHAPQAMQKFGIKAIIAESFAEIFHGNCTTLGIPCVVMDKAQRNQLVALIQTTPDAELIINIAELKVIFANHVFEVSIKDSARQALLTATYDPLDTLLMARNVISATAERLGYI